MSRPTRLLVICVALCVATATGRGGTALAESTSLAGSPLVISGSPVESELLRAQEEARLDSPEAVRARGESQTAYSGFGATESKELAGRFFQPLIDEPDGGLPRLPDGEQVSSLSSPFSAVLELPGGKHGALESTSPIAVQESYFPSARADRLDAATGWVGFRSGEVACWCACAAWRTAGGRCVTLGFGRVAGSGHRRGHTARS